MPYRGHYCSDDGKQVIPCRAGSFRSDGEVNQCMDCPVNFFNHLVGQIACFPCGSEATQPKEGLSTCLCRGEGQVFQPGDGRCPCAPGYQPRDSTTNCKQIVYDICRDGSVRNQEGQCLNKEEWVDYCSNKVCVNHEYYQGYDKVLGLCICLTEDLDNICNAECRRRQNHILQIVCVEEIPEIQAIDASGEQVPFTTWDTFGALVVVPPVDKLLCSSSQRNSFHSIYVVTVTEQGFWGIYNANRQFLQQISDGQFNISLLNLSGEDRKSSFSGILNPTTCIRVNDFIMFIVSKHNFPMYDVNNLYNTNREFDWGKFRNLAEEVWLSSRPHFLFLHQFQDPGVYVFKLSGNHYKKMYLRVMMNGGQCYEDGPFFPTAPRHVIRNGIAKAPRQLLKPDWPAITGIITGLLLILITCILLLVWFQGLGWTQKAASLPTFRRRQLKYNFNSYSSKGSTVSTAKKVHPKMRIKGHADKKWNETDRKKCQNFLTDDEFWDYEQQIDMECFSAHIFYDILLKQSLLVTAKLGHLKEEVKLYYEKLVEEVSSLKDIFLRSLNISGKQKHYSTSVLENYQKKKREAEQEIARRKKLAAEYEDILNRQLSNLQQEVKCQEEHCVEFNGALRECLRLLEMLKNKNRSEDPGTKPSTYNCRLLVLQLEGACNRMYAAVMKESERLKAWGVLGDGTGAYLVNKDRTNALTKKDLIALDGSIRESELVGVNPVHGLLTPASQTAMILSSHYLMPVPNDYFVHSETGKVLPIAGNVVYDPATSQLVTAVDSAFGEIWTAETLLFPFVPYPACPNTGLPVTCNLPSIHHHSKFEGWTLMLDNASGMEVPILAVTVHPQTRQWMALGGTYCHPLTSLISPIEIGGPMIDAKTGKIFPVLGAQLDSDTGRVIPVGGMMSMSGVISVLGDHFTEPLSGKKSRVQGAVFHQGKVVPHAGGYQALLESNLLMAEINVIDTLKALKDLIPGEDFTVNDDFEEAYRILGKAMENMKKSVATLQKHLMYRKCNASCQQKMTADFKTHGGNLGMITYPKTELWMSAVMGMEIPDPGPSDLMVPILGVEYDFVTGHLIPLAGTMEDAEGKGLIPIKLGARTIDPITGDSGSVVDAQTNPLTGIVMPIVHPGGSTKGKDYYLLEALGKELKSRERCWQNQKIKEEELLKDLKLLIYYVLDVAREDKTHKSRLKEKFASLEDVCQSIEGVGLRETQRRTDQNLCSLSIKISELPFINDNGEEMEQQLIFLMVVRKTMEKIIQFSGKIEQETEKVQSQLREWQKSKEHGSEDIVKSKQKMVTLRLVGEFEDHMMKRLTGVDTAYSRLEYVREYTRLQGLQAKSFLLGRTPQYVNSQKSYWNAHSKEVQDLGRALNPMLKYLIQIIEDNKNCVLTSEKQVPASGYSSRTTLKASAANSDSFQVAGNGDTEKTTLQLPWLISTDFIFRHQDCLFRFLMEKQASELVHLERLLITEEINKIWNFYETYKVCPYGNVEGNQSELIFSSIDTDTIEIGQRSPGKIPEACQETDLHCEWHRFIEELTEVHRAAIVALCQKHTEGVKSLGFNPASFIPEEYFNSDVKVSLLHLAKKMLSTYGQRHCDSIREVQGMTSVDCKLSLDEKAHVGLLRIIAAKFVKQELLIQIRTYTILDAYNKLQVDNCAWEIRKILHNFHYESPSGKQASEEVANAMEESQVENLIDFLRKSYKEEQLQHIQSPLSEMQVQLKEQHCSLTEQLLQNKDTSLFQELARSEDKSHMEHIIFLVLSQRHLRQAVLLQEAAKAPKHDQEKLARKWTNSADDALSVIDCLQEDIFNISNNKTEISLLLMELQHVVKRIQMRGHHVEEVANELKEYCTDKVHILSFVEEAHCFANELHAFKEQRMKQFSGQLKKLSYLARDREKPPALDRGNEEEEGFREEKTLLSALQKKQAELEQDHRKQVSDEGLKLQDRLERGELNAFWKQNLIKEHDETVTFLERTFRSDLETLKMKLEEVKKKEVEIHDVNASASSGKCCARNDEQNIATLLAENITLFQQVEQIAALRKSLLGPQLYCPSIPPAGDTTQLSEPSPVLALLKEVDSQLRENAETAQIIHGNTESHKGNTFRDILDLQLISKEKLAIVNEDDLTPREAVVYQYGIYIVELLKPRLEIAKLDLCVASSLPENCHKGNAFNNSFFYQTIEKKLYVSREYLQSVGSLVLLLVHCMSHIACEELSDDSDPFFRRAFYQAAKTCFNDGFFSTFQKCPSGQGITSSSRVHTNLETEEMQTNKCADLRLNPFLLRLKTASGKPGFNETFNDRHESLCEYKTEVLLRDILGERKRKLFNKSFKDDTNESGSKARLIENVSVKHLEDELDQLNFHLMKILEKEADLQDELKEDNKTHCYFQMITLEKECIRKKIEDLEDKIDKLMRLA